MTNGRADRRVRRVFRHAGAGLFIFLLAGSAGETRGEVAPHVGHALGKVDFPVTCSEKAQVEFNRAVALLHHMTYPQAREAFQRVATTDPSCAMAHWGIAMTLFQPLWPTRPRQKELQQGWEGVQKAKALEPPTERERLFVAAAEAFFLEPASSDYWLRIRRWEQAMEKVYASYPEDPEAAAFYALAHLATAPADTISRAHSDRAAEILLRLYERNPDHPGAMHYLVHANDVPGRERESLEITRKYEAVAPRNPHALHMPTHIYTRLGDWNAVIRGNLRAAEAALEYPAGDHGEFVWDEFPHAIEYLVYAYLQRGSDDEAAAQLKRLRDDGPSGTHLQDGLSPGVYTGPLRPGAASLERGGVDRSARARDPRLGPFHLAGSHRAVRARPGRGAPGQSQRGQSRRRASERARSGDPQGGGGPVCPEHPSAPPRAERLGCPRGRAGGNPALR